MLIFTHLPMFRFPVCVLVISGINKGSRCDNCKVLKGMFSEGLRHIQVIRHHIICCKPFYQYVTCQADNC